jgi:peptidoglycan hydrolase-like protein with peptidoglycan-binding domain
MKRLSSLPAAALLLAATLLLSPAIANDQLRDVQGALKTRGFYYGEITGADSAETSAAIRRFQIRNGITVTGKLNAETLASLGFGGKKDAAPAPQPAPAPATQPAPQPAPAPGALVQKQINPPPPEPAAAPAPQAMPKPGEPIMSPRKERTIPPEPAPAEPTPPPVRRIRPDGVSVVEPPTPVPSPVYTPYSTIFRDTRYAAATREVQIGIVRRAQAILTAKRLYTGPVDGLPAASTSEALFLFQEEAELRRTGRLDADTLAEMKLLPQPAPGSPLLKPFYNPNRRRDRSVSSE